MTAWNHIVVRPLLFVAIAALAIGCATTKPATTEPTTTKPPANNQETVQAQKHRLFMAYNQAVLPTILAKDKWLKEVLKTPGQDLKAAADGFLKRIRAIEFTMKSLKISDPEIRALHTHWIKRATALKNWIITIRLHTITNRPELVNDAKQHSSTAKTHFDNYVKARDVFLKRYNLRFVPRK